MARESPKRRCAFCGQQGLTAEHVFPRWLRRFWPREMGRAIRYDQTTATKRTWQAVPLNERTFCVCKTCNNGWMAELEVAAMPLLTPLILGEGAELPEAAQRTLATWCLKTALMHEYGAPDPLPLGDQALYLYTHRHPTPDHVIWATAYDDQEASLCFVRYRLPYIVTDTNGLVAGAKAMELGYPDTTLAYSFTMNIRRLAVQIFWAESPQIYEWVLNQPANRYFVRLWPVSPGPLAYPVICIPDVARLDAFAGRLVADLDVPGVKDLVP